MGCTVFDRLGVFVFVGWSTQCLMDWGRFARIAIPGMLMVCLEWWGFEIGVFLSGLLGTTDLGAQSVVLQIDSIWFQVSYSQPSNMRPVKLHSNYVMSNNVTV